MKKNHYKNITSENGSILFIVILGIVAISALVLFTRDRLSIEFRFVDLEYRKLKSYLNCHSGLQYALNRFLTSRQTAVALIDDLNVEFEAKFLLDGTRAKFKGPGLVSEEYFNSLSLEMKDFLKDFELEISFLDSAGLIGFQQLPPELIKNFLLFNGIDGANCDLIIDSIKDWIDIDDLTRLNGAERGYYGDVMLPANRNISSVEELCLIRGVNPEVEPAPAVMDRPAEVLHRPVIGDVERRQRRLAAPGLDAVVKLLQSAHGASDGEDMVIWRERLGDGGTEAARCAGHEGKSCHAR